MGMWLHRWDVTSFTRPNKPPYVVALKSDGTWGCSCPAWKFAKAPKGDCKHIQKIKKVEPPRASQMANNAFTQEQNATKVMQQTDFNKVPITQKPYFVVQTRRTICLEEDV